MKKTPTLGWKIGNLWFIILSLIIILNWLGLLFAGIRTKTRKWIVWSMFYLLPNVLFIILFSNDDTQWFKGFRETEGFNIFALYWFSLYISSIIHTIAISSQFLQKLAGIEGYDYPGAGKGNNMQNRSLSQNQLLIEKLGNIRDEIFNKIKNSKNFDTTIITDIKPLVNKYIHQAEELLERKEKLHNLLNSYNIDDLHTQLFDLKTKMNNTNNPDLRLEYEKSVQKHKKHLKSLNYFTEQEEVIRLRLEGIEVTMNQIKFDLIQLEHLAFDEQKQRLHQSFDEKSKDLSAYLDILKDSYTDIDN